MAFKILINLENFRNNRMFVCVFKQQFVERKSQVNKRYCKKKGCFIQHILYDVLKPVNALMHFVQSENLNCGEFMELRKSQLGLLNFIKNIQSEK